MAMNKAKRIFGITYWISGVLLVGLAATGFAAAPRSGEAVVVRKTGDLKARVFNGSIHEGRTRLTSISEGQSLGETSRLISGKDGRGCIVLSPGAILCMASETELTFRMLRHSADGLPEREDDLIRRIHIDLHKGRILLHAGVPTPSLDIQVQTDAGVVEMSGGTLAVAQAGEGEWALFSEEYDHVVTPKNGSRVQIVEGESFRMSADSAKKDPSMKDSPMRDFEVCNIYFEDLEGFFHDPVAFDREGVSRYIGAAESVVFVGSVDSVADVSPSIRRMDRNESRRAPQPGAQMPGGRWDPERIWAWYEKIGVVKGVNYISRNAANSTEMWSEEGFDSDLIDEELGWAQEAGFTTLRVQLQYVVWKEDPEAFWIGWRSFLIWRKNTIWVLFLFCLMIKIWPEKIQMSQPLPTQSPGSTMPAGLPVRERPSCWIARHGLVWRSM